MTVLDLLCSFCLHICLFDVQKRHRADDEVNKRHVSGCCFLHVTCDIIKCRNNFFINFQTKFTWPVQCERLSAEECSVGLVTNRFDLIQVFCHKHNDF